jgi:hypothetical protein
LRGHGVFERFGLARFRRRTGLFLLVERLVLEHTALASIQASVLGIAKGREA